MPRRHEGVLAADEVCPAISTRSTVEPPWGETLPDELVIACPPQMER